MLKGIRMIIVIVFLTVMCLASAGYVYAEDQRFELNASYGMREILSFNVGKRVTVRTDVGEALEGTVTKVGNHLVHISQLSGKDFYDAVVMIDRISSVVFRAR